MPRLLIEISLFPLLYSSVLLSNLNQSYITLNWRISNMPFYFAPNPLQQTTEILDLISGEFKMRYNYSPGTFPQVKIKSF